MQILSSEQAHRAAGGIPWTTPAAVAILDSASFGPLVGAFGLGYSIGTVIYNGFLADRLTF